MKPYISVRGLTKYFPHSEQGRLHVLDDVSIDVGKGEFVCLLGPSGSGKSTTLDIMAGLTRADRGQILLEGVPVDRGLHIGYVFQQPRLLNWRTVAENLWFGLRADGVPASDIAERVEQYLDLVGLRDFADAYPLTLSGGMRQRVGIARALAIEPNILLMDEPFSSLDELTARNLRAELLSIWEKSKVSILFVTHNALEAAFLADRIYVVSDRPASILECLEVELGRPRDAEDARLLEVQKRVVNLLTDRVETAREQTTPEQADSQKSAPLVAKEAVRE